ncbi:putative membrane protein [Fontibacillus solani]|uniref:Putative membrane protein n=1 Tax=Fontibacillus solani TaxID=1572857 RepID=A0A7W3SUA3_9BACL|nr:putative ABC transporter permease [Fontibacillus solani]MBA9086263.1 putative membrane protein [Fontibacillus solani]
MASTTDGGTEFDMSLDEALYYFLVYSLLGWVLENVYSYFTSGLFWKEGFLLGPYKPMYGFAPVILLLLIDVEKSMLSQPGARMTAVITLCMIVPTAVEFVSGYLLKACFGRQWWDYSGYVGQVHGHICMRFSFYWGVLSLLCLYGLQPLLSQNFLKIQSVWAYAGPLLLLIFMADFAWTTSVRRREWKQSRV